MRPAVANNRRPGSLGVALVGVGVALLVFVLYLRTLAPTVLPIDAPYQLDSPMLQMQVCVLGITHPTGYPSYIMLSHLFTYLPFGDCAYRANLASATYAALAVVVVFAAGYVLSRRVVAAGGAALAFGVGETLWSQAVIAEVYTLNALLVALTLVSLLIWGEKRRDRYLLLSAFMVGFSMTDHLTSGLLLPASVVFVGLVEWRKLIEWRLVLKGVGLFLLGLSPYLYLPLRAPAAPFKGNDPTTFERFWYVVSGGNLRGTFFAFGPAELPERLAYYVHHLLANFNWVLAAVGVVGFTSLLLRKRPVAVLLAFLFCGWIFYAVENDIPDADLSFIPTYLVFSLAMAVGFGLLLEEAEILLLGRFPRAPKAVILGVLWVAVVLSPLPGIGATYARDDMSGDYEGQKVIDEVAEGAARGSTILHHRSELWYMVLVEKRRRDLTLVDPFWHNRDIGYTDIVWPADVDLATANRLYGTDDFSGVTAAKKAAQKGPVYILSQDDVNPSGLYEAGFRTVHVKGALWQLIPPHDDAPQRGASKEGS